MSPTTADAAYFAGIVDGEGCVTVSHAWNNQRKCYFFAKVAVENTNLAVLQRAQALFGGRIRNRPPGKLGKKVLWCWQVCGLEAAALVRAILPYMIIKKDQAELLLSFVDTYTPLRYNRGGQENLPAKLAISQRISAMKRAS